jgi:hypothetical protein
VWKDPYVAGTKRSSTDRETSGLRLEWDRALGSPWGVEYQWRQIDIDDEWSGTLGGLGLTPAQISLLDREGDQHRAEVHYTWNLENGHALVPAFRYTMNDLDGDAMAYDSYAFRLSYMYQSEKFSVAVIGSYGMQEADKKNPIYGKAADADVYGIGVNAFWHRPFDLPKGYSLVGTLGYYEQDSDISFYDSQLVIAGLSMFYNF